MFKLPYVTADMTAIMTAGRTIVMSTRYRMSFIADKTGGDTENRRRTAVRRMTDDIITAETSTMIDTNER